MRTVSHERLYSYTPLVAYLISIMWSLFYRICIMYQNISIVKCVYIQCTCKYTWWMSFSNLSLPFNSVIWYLQCSSELHPAIPSERQCCWMDSSILSKWRVSLYLRGEKSFKPLCNHHPNSSLLNFSQVFNMQSFFPHIMHLMCCYWMNS